MQNASPVPSPSHITTHITRQLIQDPLFCGRHRAAEKDFTRRRKLSFMNVAVLLLQKTVRSIQLHLHDFFAALDAEAQPATNSSWCEARLKLRHTAFIELNELAILDVVYGDKSNFAVRRWKGHRLVAIDSSLVRLPNEKSLGEEFGWVRCANQKGGCGRYPQARLMALTDVLNRIAIHTCFVPWQRGERDLAREEIGQLSTDDIGLLDRGFASYELWATFRAQQRWFVCRCPASSFGIVDQLLGEDQAGKSVTVRLQPCSGKWASMRRGHLPLEIEVRFVTVRLASGELEVLATNLLDEQPYPTEEFGPLYHGRWGVETYYGLLKGRLDLEHFSGLSAEAVRQDIYATIFLSNFESILIEPVEQQLQAKSACLKNRQVVNHAVSFHALKSQMVELLLSQEPIGKVVGKLQRLLLDNPGCQRPQRVVPRRKRSAWRSYYYQRHTRKVVF
jgi:hypothetical protein